MSHFNPARDLGACPQDFFVNFSQFRGLFKVFAPSPPPPESATVNLFVTVTRGFTEYNTRKIRLARSLKRVHANGTHCLY